MTVDPGTLTATEWLDRFGRDKSLHALDGYTSLKTTWIDLA